MFLLNGACNSPELKEILTFQMSGSCLVDGPWDEPIVSHGDDEIRVLRESPKSVKGYLDVYDFQWDTEFSYKQDSIFFVTPNQTKSKDELTEGFQASGWICGEEIFIEYNCWNNRAEGSIACEVFGRLVK